MDDGHTHIQRPAAAVLARHRIAAVNYRMGIISLVLLRGGKVMTTLARHTDPETSHEAAEQTQRKLNETQQRVLSVTSLFLPMTAQEIALYAAQRYGGMAETYRKRVRELVRGNCLAECGTSKCSVTGSRATAFIRVRPQ